MNKPARLAAAAAAVAALAASAGLGCQAKDPPKPSAGDPPATSAAPRSQPPAPAGDAYAADIEKLCDVVRLAALESEPASDRRLPIATWLAANLTTAESRQFLARIQPLEGDQKADALEAEARRVGLPGCDLAAEWRSPAP